MKRKLKALTAAIMSAVITVTSYTAMLPADISAASQLIGETKFDYKMIPWRTDDQAPAKQLFSVDDGAIHVMVLNPEGEDGEKWCLQLKHPNLNFKAGHVYNVSFAVKAKREGMELESKICNLRYDEEYFVSKEDKMEMGSSMNGESSKPFILTPEYQTFSGEFMPDMDLEGVQWVFQYAKGTKYSGNTQAGDEIWFDNMSIECTTCDDCGCSDMTSYGMVSRDYCAYENPDLIKDGKNTNYISVNQLGYYPKLSKIAVLGDNQGDILSEASRINFDKNRSSYKFELVNASENTVVFEGTTSNKFFDKDSDDNVCKIDFSDYDVPGRYFLRIKDTDWRSPEFDISNEIYSDDMLTDSLNYFYQNRSGIDIESEYITSGDNKALARKGWDVNDTAAVQKTWKRSYASYDEADSENASSEINVTGGWYNAETGSKNVTGGGLAVWMLQNMYERAAQTETGKKKFADDSGTVNVPEKANGVPDILDETAYELDWMSKMVVQPDEPEWGKYAGLVYNSVKYHKDPGLAVMPDTYEESKEYARIVEPPTFAATLNYAACAAQAARLWKPYDEEKAAKYLEDAENCYEAYQMNYYYPDYTVTMHPDYGYECAKETLNEKSFFCPDHDLRSLNYGNLEVSDEAYWAACELYITTGDKKYYDELKKYEFAFDVPVRAATQEMNTDGSMVSFTRDHTNGLGTLSLLLHKDILTDKESEKLEHSVTDAADVYIETEEKQGYGIPYLYDGAGYNSPSSFDRPVIKGYDRDSNFMVMGNAMVMAYAYDIDNNIKYMGGVTSAMNYLLGCNPLSISYVTGYGSYSVKNPCHRYWASELDKKFPSAPDGVLSSGPNAGIEDNYMRALGFVPGSYSNPSQRCYADSVESWSTNSAALDGNAALAWVISFLQEECAAALPSVPAVAGDIDGNGEVTVSDLVLIKSFLTKGTNVVSPAYDVNSDGNIDVFDAVSLKRMLLKSEQTLISSLKQRATIATDA